MSRGLFTTQLDFRAGIFADEERNLEIGERLDSTGTTTGPLPAKLALTPPTRQEAGYL